MDKVFVKNLEIKTIIGIHDFEREQPQRILVSLTMFTDFTKPALTDNIADAVNYQLICEEVITIAQKAQCLLLERLSVLIADHILANYQVQKVEVTLNKPDIIPETEAVGVSITRIK